jgi:hypothetical protein
LVAEETILGLNLLRFKINSLAFRNRNDFVRQFLLRGIDNVKAERVILYTVHNILKPAKAG